MLKSLLENIGSGVIEEAGDSSSVDSLVKKISKKTDQNDHTGSVMDLAKFLNATNHIKILTAFQQLHVLYGHMPSQLIELRDYETKELLRQVEAKYGKEARDKINSAF